MIYPQIPKIVLGKIAAELNINTGLLNISLKGNSENEKTLYDKLNLVVGYIEKEFDMGTIDLPKAYFKGKIPMKWGPYGWQTDINETTSTNLVYFGGITSSNTILGLGGSLHHIIGEEQGHSYAHSHSASYAIISTLSKALNIDLGSKNREMIRKYDLDHRSYHDKFYCDYQVCIRAIELATTQMSGPTHTFEFLAKKLLEGREDGMKVVLGTPLYIAYA